MLWLALRVGVHLISKRGDTPQSRFWGMYISRSALWKSRSLLKEMYISRTALRDDTSQDQHLKSGSRMRGNVHLKIRVEEIHS